MPLIVYKLIPLSFSHRLFNLVEIQLPDILPTPPSGRDTRPYVTTSLSDDGLKCLAHLNASGKLKISVLWLSGTKITNEGVRLLMESKVLDLPNHMAQLGLSNTAISDESLKHLSSVKLKFLDLTNTAVTDDGLKFLWGQMGLFELRIIGTQVTAAGVQALQKALPKCKIIHESIPSSVNPNADGTKKSAQ